MAGKDEINSITELFLGNPKKYEHIRADIAFVDVFKQKIIKDTKVRRQLERRTGEKFYESWKDLTRDIARKQVDKKIL